MIDKNFHCCRPSKTKQKQNKTKQKQKKNKKQNRKVVLIFKSFKDSNIFECTKSIFYCRDAVNNYPPQGINMSVRGPVVPEIPSQLFVFGLIPVEM